MPKRRRQTIRGRGIDFRSDDAYVTYGHWPVHFFTASTSLAGVGLLDKSASITKWLVGERFVFTAPHTTITLRAMEGNIHFAHDIFDRSRISRKSRKRLEANAAFATIPKMTDKPIVRIFGLFRGNEIVATSNAIYSEHATRVEQLRHIGLLSCAFSPQANP